MLDIFFNLSTLCESHYLLHTKAKAIIYHNACLCVTWITDPISVSVCRLCLNGLSKTQKSMPRVELHTHHTNGLRCQWKAVMPLMQHGIWLQGVTGHRYEWQTITWRRSTSNQNTRMWPRTNIRLMQYNDEGWFKLGRLQYTPLRWSTQKKREDDESWKA